MDKGEQGFIKFRNWVRFNVLANNKKSQINTANGQL